MLDEKEVLKQMRLFNISRADAEKMVQDDLDIDKGLPKPWDLTPEQLKNQRKLCNVTTRKSSGSVTRTRKENPTKQGIISFVADALADCDLAQEVKISNVERVVDFIDADGVHYSLTLTAHRK